MHKKHNRNLALANACSQNHEFHFQGVAGWGRGLTTSARVVEQAPNDGECSPSDDQTLWRPPSSWEPPLGCHHSTRQKTATCVAPPCLGATVCVSPIVRIVRIVRAVRLSWAVRSPHSPSATCIVWVVWVFRIILAVRVSPHQSR